MRRSRAKLATVLLTITLASIAPAHSSPNNPKSAQAPNLSGLHDFDFFVGEWQSHQRYLKERLAGCHEWEEFDGTVRNWPLLGGYGNVDDTLFKMPGGDYPGVGLRAYDPKTGQWAIWWLDGRNPFGSLEPPVKGHFENGIGTFYADDKLRGKPIRVRFIWSHIMPTSAHWEQAYSPDGGKTWEVNWVMDIKRVS